MAKNLIVNWLTWASMLLGSVAVGELFLSGTFLSGTILGYLPEMVHTIAGWSIIAIGALSAFTKLPK